MLQNLYTSARIQVKPLSDMYWFILNSEIQMLVSSMNFSIRMIPFPALGLITDIHKIRTHIFAIKPTVQDSPAGVMILVRPIAIISTS